MINVLSTSLNVPDIEEISVSGRLTEESNYIQLLVKYSDLTSAQKTVYTNGISVLSSKNYTRTSNTEVNLNIDRMTSVVIEEGIDDIDFQALTTTNKNKLNALFSLFTELIGQ